MQSSRLHYGWLILLLAFFALLFVQGVRLSFGAFLTPWEADFNVTRGDVSLVALVSFAVYGISQPLFGKWVAVYGPRKVFSLSALLVGVSLLGTFYATELWHLVVLYGIIGSFGFGGASNVSASVAVTSWFKKRRGLAFGLMSSGSSVGQLTLVPASLLLIERIGWNHTILLLGGIILIVIVPLLVLFLRNTPEDKGLRPYGETLEEARAEAAQPKTAPLAVTFRVLLDRRFLFLALPFFVCGYTTMGLIDTHLIPYAHDHGFSTAVTGTAFSLLAAFNLAGTLLSGQLADHINNRRFLAGLYLMRAATVILLSFTHEPLLLLIFAALFGLVDFATIAPTLLLASNYFKRYAVGVVIGWIYLAHQLGSAAGAYITGLLYDLTGHYEIGFYIGIVLLLLAAALSLLLPPPQQQKDLREASA